jgi:primosomal replication protein N
MPVGEGLNTLVLDAEPTEVGALRRTPAGVAILEFRIAHLSRQIEAGLEREVRCELSAMLVGEAALSAQSLRPGQKLRLTGFLAARSARHTGLVMHVNTIELLEGTENGFQTQEER